MDSHETSNIENVAKDFSKATKNLINVGTRRLGDDPKRGWRWEVGLVEPRTKAFGPNPPYSMPPNHGVGLRKATTQGVLCKGTWS